MKNATFTSAKLSLIFKMAHRNAKSLEGHYQARMSMGLSIAYKHFNMLMVTDFSFLAIFNNVEASLIQNPSDLGMLRNEQMGLRPIQITLKSRDSTIPVN